MLGLGAVASPQRRMLRAGGTPSLENTPLGGPAAAGDGPSA